jgi:hypothetical protein
VYVIKGEDHPYYGTHLSDEAKENLRQKATGRPKSDETKAKLSKTSKAAWSDPDLRKEQSDRAKERWSDPEYHAAHSGENAPCYGRTGESHPLYGKQHSPETKAKMSASHKETWADPEYKAKMVELHKEIQSDPDLRVKKSESMKEYWESDPDRKKEMSAKMSGENNPMYDIHLTGEQNPHYGKPMAHVHGDYYTHPDGTTIWLRSSYEVRVADVLTEFRIPWEYEPIRFTLDGTGMTYCPDFFLPEQEIYLEVKGWMRDYDRIKLEKFFELYPNIKLRILYKSDILELEQADEIDITKFGTTTI